MEILTDFPERLIEGKMVYCGSEHTAHTIRSLRTHNEGALIGFEGLETPESVRSLTNQTVFVRSDELPALPEGEYYHHQLLGLTVVDQDGKSLGVLVEILQTGANDVYVVKHADGSELLLPAIDEVILSIDLSRSVIQVKPPEWL